MSDQFPYNSTYAFAENKLGMGVELEGLENFGFDVIWNVMRFKGQQAVDNIESGLGKMVEAGNPAATAARAINNPNFNPEKDRQVRATQFYDGAGQVYEGVSTIGHTGLDAIGLVDPTGIADGLNAAWYASEGNYGQAVLSAIAIIPLAGELAKGGKALKWAMKSDTFEASVSQIDDFTHFSFKNKDSSVPDLEVFGNMTVEGKHLELNIDVIPNEVMTGAKTLEESYSKNAGKFSQQIGEYKKGIMEWAKGQGFESIQFMGKRVTGPNKGKVQKSKIYNLTD